MNALAIAEVDGPLNLIDIVRFDKVEDLFDYVMPWKSGSELCGYIFRGHGQECYKLTPSALRLEQAGLFWEIAGGKPIENQWQWDSWQVNAEYNLLRSFYKLADRMGLEVPLSPKMRSNLAADYEFIHGAPDMFSDGIWISSDLHETAALAQHYGIPTRLLDWTYDLYVALHFGFMDAIGKDGNLSIWALNKEYLSFLRPTINRINVEFITPHYTGNPNLAAQQGLFTHWPIAIPSSQSTVKNFLSGRSASLVDRRPLDELIEEQWRSASEQNIFKKFVLPCSEASAGCRILERLRYSTARIFPGYGGVAKEIRSGRYYRES